VLGAKTLIDTKVVILYCNDYTDIKTNLGIFSYEKKDRKTIKKLSGMHSPNEC